jgi:hypothetical protein
MRQLMACRHDGRDPFGVPLAHPARHEERRADPVPLEKGEQVGTATFAPYVPCDSTPGR